MTFATIFAVLLGLVAVSTVLGLLWRASTGRVRRVGQRNEVIRVSELDSDARAGSTATLLQFSTEYCAPCVSTRALLGSVARSTAGVEHIDVDVTSRPDLANRFNLLQSPTTLILDRRGVVRARIGGAPRAADLQSELDRIVAV